MILVLQGIQVQTHMEVPHHGVLVDQITVLALVHQVLLGVPILVVQAQEVLAVMILVAQAVVTQIKEARWD